MWDQINNDLPIGIYTKINKKYKLIDGRHRYSISKNQNVQVILVEQVAYGGGGKK